ncbi:pirin family protein [Pseudoduganella eburnea]|uniref:Pirin family protein n=1 Tax=Massilia eburnea TaxID=1776165 RepID=A0A6L6QAN9_9BURK|nr:pirin family protein [Massilia eburnea]MTW09528.1 pirin family protein [Massilia eburnea]
MKNVIGVYSAPRQHWVGNGFPVRSLFSYHDMGPELSPFLLLDRAGPMKFEPAEAVRGVGQHPHRGFETVTIVYRGEVAHRDSTGQGGVITDGDVQWMTAASGILHEEFHSEAFTRAGGILDMVQLWVNLPAKDKMSAPGYQHIDSKTIPRIGLPDGAGALRVIAGNYEGHQGPARTFTPMNVWDLQLKAGVPVRLPAADGWNTAVTVLHGAVMVNENTAAQEAELVVLSRTDQDLTVEASSDAVVLLLSGLPIDEPIVGHGPFVMNSDAEIEQAFRDFTGGKFGKIPGN